MRRLTRHINSNSKMYSQTSLVCGYMFAMCASLTGDMSGFPWEYSYYHLNEGAFVMYLFCSYILVTNNTPKWSYNWQAFALLVFLSPIASIADEIAQSATTRSWSDLYHFGAILMYVIIWRRRKGRIKYGDRE